jgi:hypothetical protein
MSRLGRRSRLSALSRNRRIPYRSARDRASAGSAAGTVSACAAGREPASSVAARARASRSGARAPARSAGPGRDAAPLPHACGPQRHDGRRQHGGDRRDGRRRAGVPAGQRLRGAGARAWPGPPSPPARPHASVCPRCCRVSRSWAPARGSRSRSARRGRASPHAGHRPSSTARSPPTRRTGVRCRCPGSEGDRSRATPSLDSWWACPGRTAHSGQRAAAPRCGGSRSACTCPGARSG